MRIARRRSVPAGIPSAAIAAGVTALALVVIVALSVSLGRPARQPGGGGLAGGATLTMADAFGLGGLSRLRAPNADGAALPSPVRGNLVVSYYGTPQAPSMGILGQEAPEQAADLLAERAARFRFLTRSWEVLPALHLVYAVAQPDAGAGSLQYLDDRTVRQFIALARRRGFAVILDLQIGHSNALAEVQRVAPYLREPDVFVALDPEFALPSSATPGDRIGSIDAADINAVQAYLAQLTAAERLPKKMLIVHQFDGSMITHPEAIQRSAGVDLVIDMDGYGPAGVKEAKYHRYGAAPYAPYGGIKVFLQHDPDPLSEASLLALVPRPALVVYQ
ncbi:MAG: hypothetical protein ACYC9X_11115 [Dehalococcoidia bacterium]